MLPGIHHLLDMKSAVKNSLVEPKTFLSIAILFFKKELFSLTYVIGIFKYRKKVKFPFVVDCCAAQIPLGMKALMSPPAGTNTGTNTETAPS